jgi:HSP20 family protein
MLVRWNPFANGSITRSASLMSEFDAFFREADSLWRATFPTDAAVLESGAKQATLLPASEIHENENALTIHVDLPGHTEKEIQVRVEGDTVTIQSERKREQDLNQNGTLRTERTYGLFARSFVLPDSVDANACEARYKNGVLSLTFPKREEAKPKTINIRVQS